MSLRRCLRGAVVAGSLLAGSLLAVGQARAQFVDRTIVVDQAAAPAPAATADDRPETLATTDGEPVPVEARLTLSSFLYRESAAAATPLVANGAAPAGASAARRLFGDLRGELTVTGVGGGALHADGRVRQTTAARYQSGAVGGDEYEVRELTYARALGKLELRLGRQIVDAVGATKIDGVALAVPVGRFTGTVFGGAYPVRGSRSVATDYQTAPSVAGGTTPVVPLVAGGGVAYQRPTLHGDLGLAGVIAPWDVAGTTAADRQRVFVTTGGYWRPHPSVDLYQHGVVDVVASDGPRVTEASVGLDVWPTSTVTLSLSGNHVSNELYTLAARDLLAEPDPAATGQVENGTTIVRVAQDSARASASLAVAQARFQLTAGVGLHRRPGTTVIATGGAAVEFPSAAMGELTVAAVDRRSLGGTRVEASATALTPVGTAAATRSRGVSARLAVTRARRSHELTLDLTADRFVDLGDGDGCTTLDLMRCFGTATTRGLGAGGQLSLGAGRDWLVLFDLRGGVRATDARFAMADQAWPSLLWGSAFARLQWRYR
ncbi:MAG: hypothetical protein R3B06_21205 [Kofleriaceae bacterium]